MQTYTLRRSTSVEILEQEAARPRRSLFLIHSSSPNISKETPLRTKPPLLLVPPTARRQITRNGASRTRGTSFQTRRSYRRPPLARTQTRSLSARMHLPASVALATRCLPVPLLIKSLPTVLLARLRPMSPRHLPTRTLLAKTCLLQRAPPNTMDRLASLVARALQTRT